MMKKNFAIALTIGSALTLTAFTYNYSFASPSDQLPKQQDSFALQSETHPKQKKFDVIGIYKSIEKTETGLKKYKAMVQKKNEVLVENGVNDILVTVTFNNPISYEQLTKVVKDYKVTLKQIQGRALSGNERITLGIAPGEKMHENVLSHVNSLEGTPVFEGYIDFYGTVDFSNLKKLENDGLVFLVDSSGDSFFNETEDNNPHSLSWDLEDLK
jgi:hypothetical protein